MEHRPADWADLAALLGPGGFADLFSAAATPPDDWAPVFTMEGVQLVGGDDPVPGGGGVAGGGVAGGDGASGGGPRRGGATRDRVEVVELGPADVPDMLGLAGRTAPGPFWAGTIGMGTYLGVRDGGQLVAMAGERLRPPGWTEISSVCTAPEARGRGLASRLVQEAASRVVARAERPFLHVAADNTAALALYERLGFRTRRPVTFRGFRVPG